MGDEEKERDDLRVMADLGPMPSPKTNLARNMCHQVLVKACQKQAAAETEREGSS